MDETGFLINIIEREITVILKDESEDITAVPLESTLEDLKSSFKGTKATMHELALVRAEEDQCGKGAVKCAASPEIMQERDQVVVQTSGEKYRN